MAKEKSAQLLQEQREQCVLLCGRVEIQTAKDAGRNTSRLVWCVYDIATNTPLQGKHSWSKQKTIRAVIALAGVEWEEAANTRVSITFKGTMRMSEWTLSCVEEQHRYKEK